MENNQAIAFKITQNNDVEILKTALLGDTKGLSNFSIKLTGNANASGTFQNDPFDLKSGIVLSTGNVKNLATKNIADGGFSPGTSIPLRFIKLPGRPNEASGSDVFYADLSKIGFDINSILFADSGSFFGGSTGPFSGFDLDSIKLSNVKLESAEAVNSIPGLDVFDFTPAGTVLAPGSQRPPVADNDVEITPELRGILNGNINNLVATLERFDSTGSTNELVGAMSLGDNGKIGFNLTQIVSTVNKPLYLYVGESGRGESSEGESPDGLISVSNRFINELNDLSTDFGFAGATNDSIKIEIEFDADNTAEFLYFEYVFGSEEFVEFAGSQFNDSFSLTLNGFNFARLSNGDNVSINNLAFGPYGAYHPDFVRNEALTGPLSNQTSLDGYTKPLTFVGLIEPGARNTLVIELKDVRDGLLDSAVFLKGGTLGTVNPGDIQREDGAGGSKTIEIDEGDRLVIIDNFGGIGRGTNPTAEAIAELDTLKFKGDRFTAKNLLLTQNNQDLEITFEGSETKVILKNFSLENLDNLTKKTGGAVDLGNILFDGQEQIQDSFDVFNSEWNFDQVLNSNSVTFLNALNNTVRGFDNSNDVIHGQAGNDILLGLGGDDILRGGAGNDILRGGSGVNILVGNGGADIFGLSRDGTAIVKDFDLNQDLIDLRISNLLPNDLKIEQGTGADAADTWIRLASNNQLLMKLEGIQATALSPFSFLSGFLL
ncbi:Serralysin B precursor [Leptolyngbya sp. O-77]|nr:Serralysin B precursor [Leptolyngbya sp. O-77]